MASGDLVVGLDIGTTKVCTIIADVVESSGQSAGGASVEILGVGVAPSTGVRRGVIVDIEQTVSAIKESVKQAQRMAGADVHSVIVGVTGEHIASLNSRGVIAITHADREVTESDVARVMENSKVIVLPPDREIIHALPRGYSLDGQNGIRSPVGMSGTRLEVETHIVTGATTFLRNVAACVERAGFHIEDMVLEPVATGEAVLLPGEKQLGVVLVDIGGGTSDIAIFRGGDIGYTSVVPIGGAYVTSDIAAGLRVTPEEAERIKMAHGHAQIKRYQSDVDERFDFTRLGAMEISQLPGRELFTLIEPRVSELFHMVKQEIARSPYAGVLPGGMVLSGGGSLLSGLAGLAEDITGLPVRLGSPQQAGTRIGGLAESVEAPSFATAVGLVLWGGRLHAAHGRGAAGGANGFLLSFETWWRRVVQRYLRP